MSAKILAPREASCVLSGRSLQPDSVTCFSGKKPVYKQRFNSNEAAKNALEAHRASQADAQKEGSTADTARADVTTTDREALQSPEPAWAQSIDWGNPHLDLLAEQGATVSDIQTAAESLRAGLPEPMVCTAEDPFGLGFSKPPAALPRGSDHSIKTDSDKDCSNKEILRRLDRKEPGFKNRVLNEGGPLNVTKGATGKRDLIQQKLADERRQCHREGR